MARPDPPDVRPRWPRRRRGIGAAAGLLAGALLAAPEAARAQPSRADPARWLAVEVVSRDGESVRLRLTNLSGRALHPLGPRSWGTANFVKVGFEAAPFPRLLPAGRWTDGRPDLDFGFRDVWWAPLDVLVAAGAASAHADSTDLEPGQPVEIAVPLPPPEARGNLELIVLARRGGTEWLTFRRTVGTRLFLPGDLRALLLRAALLAGLGLVAWRARAADHETRSRTAALGARGGLAHSLAVLVLASVILGFLHSRHYRELPYTDGATYAVLARSHMEGHGLVSPVIFPGLMKLVPTTRQGQVFVMQAPLWPLLLAWVFRVVGPTALAVAVTGYVLAALAALSAWWITVLAVDRSWAGYLAVVMLLANPIYYAAVSNGSTVSLQSALAGGLVLLMWAPLGLGTAVAAGLLTGLGIVARENTVFVSLGLLLAWLPAAAAGFRDRTRRRRLAVALAAGLLCAAVPVALESARKARALGGPGHPVLHATLLYGTPAFDRHWFWYYDHPLVETDPVGYFRAHPAALWEKVRTQVGTVFLRETLPALLAPSPWFVPVVLPWLFPTAVSRRAGACLLAAVLLQVAGAAVSYLHPSYFVVFIPALTAGIAASVAALGERLWRPSARAARPLAAVVLAYALLPFMLDLGPMARAGGVRMGDLDFDPRALDRLYAMVREHTAPDAVIAFGHIPAALLAWHTHRTVVSYDPAPPSRPADSDSWRRLDRQLPLDGILLSSLTDADTAHVLGGFELAATEKTRWLEAWLFARAAVPRPAP